MSDEVPPVLSKSESVDSSADDGTVIGRTVQNSHPENPEQSIDSCKGEAQKTKIVLLLKATGNAPIMKQKRWVVEPEKKIGKMIEFVKRYLKLEASESLFLYVNQAFAPSPDQTVQNVFDCFGTDGKLILHYSISQAWG